jgi:integrase
MTPVGGPAPYKRDAAAEDERSAHVVQQSLGHKRVEITLGIYAHVLPSMQQDAAQAARGVSARFVIIL